MNRKGEAEIMGSKTLSIIIAVIAIVVLAFIIYKVLSPIIK